MELKTVHLKKKYPSDKFNE